MARMLVILDNSLEEINAFDNATRTLFLRPKRLLESIDDLKIQCGRVSFSEKAGAFDYSQIDPDWMNTIKTIASDIEVLEVDKVEREFLNDVTHS